MRKLLILSLLCFALACRKEKHDYDISPVKFTAGISPTEASKTSIGELSEDGSYPVLWSEGDKIAISAASTPAHSSVYTTSDDLTDIAEFHYDTNYDGNSRLQKNGGKWFAFYPAQLYSYSDGKHCLSFNNAQVYKPESFQSGAMPMIAVSEDTNLQFKNLCGVFRIRICSAEDSAILKAIRLTSETVSFSGMFSLTNESDSMEWHPDNNENGDAKSLTLDIPDAIELSPTPTDFHIVVPPVLIPDLIIELQTVIGESTKSFRYKVPEDISIERSQIITLSVDLTQFTAMNSTDIKIDDTVHALTCLSYKFTTSERSINVFREGGTGTVDIESFCHKEFADGSVSDAKLPTDCLYSTDGGTSWSSEIPSMFSSFNISDGKIIYEIKPDSKSNDCLVQLIQKESGKSVILPFRQSCNAIIITYTTDPDGTDSLLCNILDNNVRSVIFNNGEERIIEEARGSRKFRATLPSQEINSVIYRLKSDEEISLYQLFHPSSSPLKYRVTSADLSHLDMSRIISFKNLFHSCLYLEKCLLPEDDEDSALEDMSMMFYNCQSLTDIDLSTLNTSSVTDMGGTFRYCKNLKSINLNGVSTGNVYNFSSMFSGCINLSAIDVSGFDTSNSISFAQMFQDCTSLKKIDVSGFNTDKVRYMYEMFRRASVKYLDLSNFNFENSEDLSFMFYSCYYLKSIDISEIVAPKLKDTREMFSNTGLEALSISRFKCGDNCNMYGMFSNNSSLNTVSLPDFDASRASDMYELFYMCSSLTELDCSGFKTDSVTNMQSMFAHCIRLEKLDVSPFSTANVTNMASMFASTKVTGLNLSSFDTHNVTNMASMFSSCQYITALDLSSFNVEKVTDMSVMFGYCVRLTDLNISNFYTPSLQTTYKMFSECEKLLTLDLSKLCTDNVTDMAGMFEKCRTLTSVDVSHLSGASLEKAGSMFSGCWCITEINLQNLSLSKIKQTSSSSTKDNGLEYMFNECRSLRAIYMDMRNSAESFSAINMFSGTYAEHTLYVKDGIINDNVKAVLPDDWSVASF